MKLSLLFLLAASTQAAPLARISVSTIEYGNVPVGTSQSRKFKLFSIGSDPLLLQSIAVSGAAFAVTTPTIFPRSLAPGSNLDVSARFSPTAAGPAIGSVSVSTNASSALTPVVLGAVGVSSSTTSPGLTAGDVLVGPGVQGVFAVSLVNASGIQVSGIAFDVLQEPGAISLTSVSIGGAATRAGRTFSNTPLAGGNRILITGPVDGAIADGAVALVRFLALGGKGPTGRIALTNIQFGTTTNAALALTGSVFGTATISSNFTPVLATSPSVMNFGAVRTGLTVSRTLTLQNIGTGTLNLNSALITSGSSAFTISAGSFSQQIAPGATSSPLVRFAPQVEGAFLGTLTIRSDSENSLSTKQILLVGLASGPSSASIEVKPGTVATFSVANDLDTTAPGLQLSVVYSNLTSFEGQPVTVVYANTTGNSTATRTATVQNGQIEVRIPVPASDGGGQLTLSSQTGTLLQANPIAAEADAAAASDDSKGVKCSLSGGGGSLLDLLVWLGLMPILAGRRFRTPLGL